MYLVAARADKTKNSSHNFLRVIQANAELSGSF